MWPTCCGATPILPLLELAPLSSGGELGLRCGPMAVSGAVRSLQRFDKRRLKGRDRSGDRRSGRRSRRSRHGHEEKQERKDDSGRGKTNAALRNELARHRRLIGEMIEERVRMEPVGAVRPTTVDYPVGYDPDHPFWQEDDETEERPYDYMRDGQSRSGRDAS